jgi:hypothetical protein
MTEMLVEKLRLVQLLDSGQADRPDELVFAYYYVSYMCSYAFHMRQRKILSDNEWAGWMRWMKSAFERETIREYWEKEMDPGNWFNPAFEDFINNEIIPKSKW